MIETAEKNEFATARPKLTLSLRRKAAAAPAPKASPDRDDPDRPRRWHAVDKAPPRFALTGVEEETQETTQAPPPVAESNESDNARLLAILWAISREVSLRNVKQYPM